MTEFATLYTTAPDEPSARQLARAGVEARLAACANILPGVTSVYHWRGAVEEEGEVAVIFKTRMALVEELIGLLEREHPYEVPMLTVYPIGQVSPAYAAWLREETEPARG